MHVSYDIVDLRVAISFTDRMFQFLLDGHAHSHAGGLDSARLSPPASGRGRLLRYGTRCYFNVRSKADMSQLNLPHGNDKQLKSVKQKN